MASPAEATLTSAVGMTGAREVDALIFGQRRGIALGTVIENAAGGQGNDVLIGNAASNTLTGGSGCDTAIFQGSAAEYRLQAYRLYKAAFDREPDSAGLGYWNGIEYLEWA